MRASQRRQCPVCNVDSVELSLFNVKRRRQVTCHSCGTKLDIVVPGGPYYLVIVTVSILVSMLVPVTFTMMLGRQWATIALGLVLMLALILGCNELLNRRAIVQRAPGPESSRS